VTSPTSVWPWCPLARNVTAWRTRTDDASARGTAVRRARFPSCWVRNWLIRSHVERTIRAWPATTIRRRGLGVSVGAAPAVRYLFSTKRSCCASPADPHRSCRSLSALPASASATRPSAIEQRSDLVRTWRQRFPIATPAARAIWSMPTSGA